MVRHPCFYFAQCIHQGVRVIVFQPAGVYSLDRELFLELVAGQRDQYLTEKRYIRRDGSLFWGSLSGRAIDPAHPQEGSIWIYSDISERKATEARIEYLAHHDVVTELPNRTLLVLDPTSSAPRPALLEGKRAIDGKPTVYVCHRVTCSAPATEWDAVAALLT